MKDKSKAVIKTTILPPKDEKERQIYRKKQMASSRFLDNYYNGEVHSSKWNAIGTYIIKKKYTYGSDVGLGHFYEKNNVLEKKEVISKSTEKKINKPRDFVEYEFMEENDIIVTIEHCSNCDDHSTHTNHSTDGYKNFAKLIQKAILIKFPFIKVFLKPIDTDIIKHNLKKISSLDDKYKEVRIGAMEIQFSKFFKGKKEIVLIHSKLSSGEWPSISNLINKIMQYVPRLNLQINVFDIESQDEAKKITSQDDFEYSRFENVKVNIYQLRLAEFDSILKTANDEVQYVVNPHKRIEYLNNEKLKILEEKPSLYKEIINKSTIRPLTGTSLISTNNANNMNNSKTHLKENQSTITMRELRNLKKNNLNDTQSIRPSSTMSIFRSGIRSGIRSAKTHGSPNYNQSLIKLGKLDLEDEDIVEQLKGNLVASVFTNKLGCISLEEIPYNSYLIEIKESKNFQFSSGIVSFPKILHDNEFKKHIGLRKQTNAYIEIYLYFSDDTSNDLLNMKLIEGANIVLIRTDVNNFDPSNDFGKLKFYYL